MIEIPVINFQPFQTGTPIEQQAIAQQIYYACRHCGFMYLQNYGFTDSQVDQIFTQTRQFFALPLDVKKQVLRSPLTNCGYVPMQAERLNPQRPGDLKEAFNVGEQSIWLADQPSFQQVVSGFYQDAMQVAFQLLQAFAIALELPETFFVDRHGQNFFLRLLHYPPLNMPIADQQIRAGEHTDYGSVTLLLQDSAGGLEICTPQGDWLPVPVVPGAVLVNIGDAMQRWTNDVFRSTPHRVVNPPGVEQERSRYSIALFCDPNPEVEIACLPSCVQPAQPSRYPPVRYADYLQAKFATTY